MTTAPRLVAITGATGGIGLHTARGLAQRGYGVVLMGRNAEKAERVRAQLVRDTGNDDLHVVLGDLGALDDVRRMAGELRDRFGHLDVLVNNAGAMNDRRELTADGFERTFAVNHLAPFLLTLELLDVLRASGAARVVTVASDAHRAGRLNLTDPMYEQRRYSMWGAYCQSKLANVLFAAELARRLEGTPVTSNSLHPGFVRSGFGRNNSLPIKAGAWLSQRFAISAASGAKTSIHLADSEDVAGVSGLYWARCAPSQEAGRAQDAEAAERLWARSEELTGAGL